MPQRLKKSRSCGTWWVDRGRREGRPGKPMATANPWLQGVHGHSKRSRTTSANGRTTTPCRLETEATRMGARTGARSRTDSNPASAKELKWRPRFICLFCPLAKKKQEKSYKKCFQWNLSRNRWWHFDDLQESGGALIIKQPPILCKLVPLQYIHV